MKKLFLFCICVLLMGCVEGAVTSTSMDQQQQISKTNEPMKALTKLQHGIVFADYWEYPDINANDRGAILHVKVKYVKPNSVADEAGFKVGDEIITINGENPWDHNWNTYLMSGDNPVTYTMRRGKDEYKTKLNPI
ncbi:MAG: PDZ domain-containing protein [Deltaproteobacteria bacterium]|nr:PDZ domain-containing protein [Deltaproteobacteria bacterium]